MITVIVRRHATLPGVARRRSKRPLLAALACVPLATSLVSAQQPPKFTGSCTDAACHGDYARRPVVHAPVSTGTCDACHEEVDPATHTFRLNADGAALCTECHEAFAGSIVHGPVADGCTSCHDPHGSKAPKLISQDSVAALCADCHEDMTEGKGELHGPVAVGECLTCHTPHASSQKNLLVRQQPELCVECHEDAGAELAAKKHVHAPLRDGCTTCHQPHASDNKHFLTAKRESLCAECHADIIESAEAADVRHSPVTTGEMCLQCHVAHASDESGLLTTAQGSLCLSCHDQVITTGDRQIDNLAGQLSGATSVHGPVQEGQCASCHQPHGAAHSALLAKTHPSQFYVAFEDSRYELCFDCHDSDAFAEAITEDGTNFRNGTQNLHHAHVHRTKGRNCRVCHDPHASAHGKLIATSVPFGRWKIPLNFRETSTGGSCQPGCHRAYRYDRDSPIVNFNPR